MGDNDADGKPSDKPALEKGAWGGKAGGSGDVFKKDGPKGEKAWGNRRPEPEDPSAPKKGPAQEISVGPIYVVKSNVDHVYGETDKSAIDPDKTLVQTLKVTASDIEFGSAAVKLNEGKAKLVGVTASAIHGQIDLVKVIGTWLFGKPTAPAGSEVRLRPAFRSRRWQRALAI